MAVAVIADAHLGGPGGPAEPLIEQLKDRHTIRFVHRPTGLEDVFLRLTGRELRE
mgnify:CR=1 FL=1